MVASHEVVAAKRSAAAIVEGGRRGHRVDQGDYFAVILIVPSPVLIQ